MSQTYKIAKNTFLLEDDLLAEEILLIEKHSRDNEPSDSLVADTDDIVKQAILAGLLKLKKDNPDIGLKDILTRYKGENYSGLFIKLN